VTRLRYPEAPEGYRQPTLVEACAEWMVDVLEERGESVASKEMYALAAEEGFNRGLVYWARKVLAGRVVDTAGGRSPKNRWELAAEPQVGSSRPAARKLQERADVGCSIPGGE
jgi:hypothetical protein